VSTDTAYALLTLSLLRTPIIASVSKDFDELELEALFQGHEDGSFTYNDIPDDRPTLTLPLKDDHQPAHNPQYPIPQVYMRTAKEQILRWLEEGKIERTGPGRWNTAFFPKVEENKIRLCFNFEPTNGQCDDVFYPLPEVNTLLDRVASNTYYTVLDLSSGYHQVKLNPDQREVCAFSHPELGRFRWKVIPFGLGCAPPSFHALISSIFRPLIDAGLVSVYVDDIIVHTTSREEHVRVVKEVVEILHQHKLVYNPKKVQLFQTQVRFLGHLVSYGSIQVLPEHQLKMQDFPDPTTPKQLQRFLGATQWVARFCPHLGEISGPLYAATSRKTLKWDPQLREAYQQTKESILDPAILVPYDPSEPLTLQADASDFGWGAALIQPRGVVAFSSGTFHDHEANWTIREKELSAVLKALRAWTFYTYGRPLTVTTDHKPNTAIHLKKKVNYKKILGWLEELNGYNIRWTYLPGKDNTLCDWLSRLHEADSRTKGGGGTVTIP
jgi:putative transposase